MFVKHNVLEICYYHKPIENCTKDINDLICMVSTFEEDSNDH